MNSKRKEVNLKFIKDEDIPFTLNLRTKEKKDKRSYRFTSIQELVYTEDEDINSNTELVTSTISEISRSETKRKNERLTNQSPSKVKSETPDRRANLSKTYDDTNDSVTESIATTSYAVRKRKSERLKNRSVSYCELQDSLEESPDEGFRKLVVTEKSVPDIRRSNRLSSVTSQKSTLSPVREAVPSPSFPRNKTKNVATPQTPRRKSTLPESRSPGKSGAKQKAVGATPVQEATPLCATPKSTKRVSRLSNGSSSVPRRILHSTGSGNKTKACVTPTSACKSERVPKTPNTVRRRLGYELRTRIEKIEFKESDMSDSEDSDEYEQLSSSSDESEFTESDTERKRSRTKFPFPMREDLAESITSIPLRTKHRFDYNFTLNADEYFISKSSSMPTSNNKLSTVQAPDFEEEELKAILTTSYTKHKLQMDSLILHYENFFRKWLFYLEEGFNLLMYGLGSKIELLKDFHGRMLHCHHVVTIHGNFPGLTIKNILSSLLVNILKEDKYPRDMNEALSFINDLTKSKKLRIFIIVYNIDGSGLRESKYQKMFCKLASFPFIHLIASIDHINAPLLWGNSEMSQFNFIWLHVTTYRPYINETSFDDALRLMESSSEYVSLSSLREIFRPLVQKVKKIFEIIAKDRLENKNNKNYKGMSMTDWYRKARSAFLVNNKNTFRVMLTELVDHKIISLQNEDCISLRIRLYDLEVFYEQQFSDKN